MADPVTATLAGVSIASSAAGGIAGAYGANAAGQAKSDMYNYQAGISRLNEKYQKWNARQAIKTGEIEQVQLGMKQGQQMGQIKAAQGASGIDMNSGTSVTVRESQEAVNKMDRGLLRRNTANKAYAFEVGAAGEAAQAGLYDIAATNAEKEGKIGAISSLIGGASSVSSKWLQARQSGAFA